MLCQLYSNEIDLYMRGNEPMYLDPSNLMVMRYNLHLAQLVMCMARLKAVSQLLLSLQKPG